MYEKTVYVAEDGAEFDSIEKCKQHEIAVFEVDNIMSKLLEPPPLNNDEYYVHEINHLRRVRNEFIHCAAKAFNGFEDFFEGALAADHNQTFIGRIIDDSGNRALRKAWFRFMCIDMITGREYNQPYYVNQLIQMRNITS